MGVGVSNWRLARAVSRSGQLGVVSGVALDAILARRLQLGDVEGVMRQAMAAFPDQGMADRVLVRYFINGGKDADQPFRAKPVVSEAPAAALRELMIVSGFVEVYAAKQGHDGVVGINFLEKIQTPFLPMLYGAMLAGVDVIIMGAGIPRYVPQVLDRLAEHQPVSFDLQVIGAADPGAHQLCFDPQAFPSLVSEPLKRPAFFPIVASNTLATVMAKKSTGTIQGLVIEGHLAGGHNAPPRSKGELDGNGEPVYGPRDAVNLEQIKKLGVPFWLAGAYGSPERLEEALGAGAAGVQVGTLFAFCNESGLESHLKQGGIAQVRSGNHAIHTDPQASPTGFPFKVLDLPQTLSRGDSYAKRERLCDLGYLREAYEKADGTIGWRCAAEDEASYLKKGGQPEDMQGRKCLCNGLMANIGLQQTRTNGTTELPLVTCGDDLPTVLGAISPGCDSYTAQEAIDFLLARTPVGV